LLVRFRICRVNTRFPRQLAVALRPLSGRKLG
jgi:hypothetical protein